MKANELMIGDWVRVDEPDKKLAEDLFMNTNKIDLIKAEVERLKSNLIQGACASQLAMETRCKEEAYNEVLAILDTTQEEPVSEDLEKAARNYTNNLDNICGSIGEQTRDAFKAGAKWQKAKDESITEDLGEYINELSKQFPEVSFAKLSRIAVRVSKWQKQKDEKAINENALLYNARLEGIEVGKAEMKHQMMVKAIDVEVKVDAGGYPYIDKTIELYDYDRDIPLAKEGDRYKVILIKED